MRDTSVEAYHEIGKRMLSDRQRLVFSLIRDWPDSTDAELTRLLVRIHGGAFDPNRVRPRRNELLRMGRIEESGKRRCSVTKMTATTWRVAAPSKQGRLFE